MTNNVKNKDQHNEMIAMLCSFGYTFGVILFVDAFQTQKPDWILAAIGLFVAVYGLVRMCMAFYEIEKTQGR